MIQFSFEKVSGIGNREPYNNVAAHEELKSMMSRFDRLNIFFDIDEDGYEVIKVESTYVKRFAYQLNDESANWLMTYLSTGKSEDFGVEPSEVQKSDQTNGNEYRRRDWLGQHAARRRQQHLPQPHHRRDFQHDRRRAGEGSQV